MTRPYANHPTHSMIAKSCLPSPPIAFPLTWAGTENCRLEFCSNRCPRFTVLLGVWATRASVPGNVEGVRMPGPFYSLLKFLNSLSFFTRSWSKPGSSPAHTGGSSTARALPEAGLKNPKLFFICSLGGNRGSKTRTLNRTVGH